jgi:hypothetical protein
MRVDILLVAVVVTACVGQRVARSDVTNDLAVSLTRARADDRPVILVTMTNHSQADICIRAELLRDPYSYEMELRLRDANGRAVKRYPPGFLSPPIMEAVRIAPGHSVQGKFYLDARFKKEGGKQLPRQISAQASFRYDRCDASQSQRAISAWQQI